MSLDAFVGEIMLFAGDEPPPGWLLCDGAAYDASQYEVLFHVLGFQYGGNEEDSFLVPDLRGRMPVGWSGPDTSGDFSDLGKEGGADSQTVKFPVTDYVAPHTHPAAFTPDKGSGGSPAEVVVNSAGGTSNTNVPTNNYLATAHVGSSTPVLCYNQGTGGSAENLAGVKGGGKDTTGTVVVAANTPGPVPASTQILPTMPPYLVLNYCICYRGINPFD